MSTASCREPKHADHRWAIPHTGIYSYRYLAAAGLSHSELAIGSPSEYQSSKFKTNFEPSSPLVEPATDHTPRLPRRKGAVPSSGDLSPRLRHTNNPWQRTSTLLRSVTKELNSTHWPWPWGWLKSRHQANQPPGKSCYGHCPAIRQCSPTGPLPRFPVFGFAACPRGTSFYSILVDPGSVEELNSVPCIPKEYHRESAATEPSPSARFSGR